MTELHSTEIWQNIVALFEEKLQYGFLEQCKNIASVHIEGNEIQIEVRTAEAEEFFNAEINQRRLMLISRPILNIGTISITRRKDPPSI